MKQVIISFLFIVCSSCCFAEEWLEKKSAHFIIFYKEENYSGYVDEVAVAAEGYYRTILNSLGFYRFDFWTWDNRCKIFLYVSKDSYYNDAEHPSWSAAHVQIKERVIRSSINGKFFIDYILPHEMGHLVFREFIGYEKNLPLWIDEGVACLQEGTYRNDRLSSAKKIVKADMAIPIDKLNTIQDAKAILVPSIFYAEAVSIIDFLLTQFGNEKFLRFCREIRDGESWDEVMLKVYGFKDFEDIDEKWRAFLGGS